jgi:signal transduction histidine kinase
MASVTKHPPVRSRLALGIALVVVGLLLAMAFDGPSKQDQIRVLVPLVAVGSGLAILWREVDTERRILWLKTPDRRRSTVHVRAAAGALIVIGSLVRLLTNGSSVVEETSAILAALVLFAGAVLIALPYLLRVIHELGAERAERIRVQENAEVAAHMHDSVLHTLTLIQRTSNDPAEVARLARAQERDLRTWLYDRRMVADGDSGDAFAQAVKDAAAEVEDGYGVRVEVVAVGDAELDDELRACVAAAREAMVNAAKYAAGAPISVYAEVESDDSRARWVDVYVRDRGPGFDWETVGEDRMGIRQSIVGRMERHGGRAVVRTSPGDGTEIRLELRRE